MVNKKKRLFKLLFFPISLLLCLSIFLINSFARSGFDVVANGNIVSLNLFDGELVNGYHSGSNGNLILTNGTLVSNKNLISLDHNTYYTISFVANDICLDGINYYYSNGSFKSYEQLNNQISPYTFFLSNDEYYISFNFISNSNIDYTQITNVMLNEGQIAYDYFPSGYYYNNSVNRSYSIYNIFNGVDVWLQNLTSDGAILTETLSLNTEQTSITFSDLPNIRSYIVNHPTYEPFTLIFYFGNNNMQNASYVITLNSYDWQPTIKLSGFSDKIFNRSNDSNSFIVNTFNESYSSLSVIDFESSYDVINSFRISLVQADTSYYNNGYRDGYNDGLNDGENIGYNSGYQSGYNTGSTTNIETNGIKTLFNSILSFPVDMIKSVFNFEFMGVNISSVIMFIVSIGIVAFVLKKFL